MRLAAVAMGLALLVGCGRGGDGDGDDDDFVGTGDTAEAFSGEVPQQTDDAWPPAWRALEDEVLVLVNEARSQPQQCGGANMPAAAPLEMHPLLRDVARAHSEDMAVRGFFDHVNPDGDDPFDRLVDAGWSLGLAGENIAQGYPNAEEVVSGWMRSPGHCSNIMEGGFRFIGIGYYEGHYWTQVFGG